MAVIIITGETDSGKTTWCKRNLLENGEHEYGGVLLLKIYSRGERIGYDALNTGTGQTVPFARLDKFKTPHWDEEERIGGFSISKEGKSLANMWICYAFTGTGYNRGIIIDEAGPLELDSGGLAEGLCFALKRTEPDHNLYLVVRRDCVEPVVKKFNIRNYQLIPVSL